MSLKKSQAAAIISEHFRVLKGISSNQDVLVSAKEAGRQMVEIYRLLTSEMPQSTGIEVMYNTDEVPAVEWASPTERPPDELFYVRPGFGREPDILIKGDQDGEGRKEIQGISPKALKGKEGEDHNKP
jgi:hypothetical protein